jgi:hypothetical protein
MGQRYTFNYLWIILIAVAISINFAFTLGYDKPRKGDTSYVRKSRSGQKQSNLKSGLSTTPIPQVKTSSSAKPVQPLSTDKLLSNVQIYPNPITDQINLKYMVARNANVNIKIMDVLGNNVATLFSERVESGEKKFTYYLASNRLTSGFYFLRVMVGTESVIRRITIL